MAHNIATIKNNVAFAFSGERPWHRLGKRMDRKMTVAEALKEGHVDGPVYKEPIFLQDGIVIPDKFATVRYDYNEDNLLDKIPLGVVGARYEIVQTADCFAFFDHAIGEDAACIETVGALGRGEVVFAMARVPDDMEVTPGDPIERYILLTTSHDGSSNIRALFSPVRVVCNNTLNAALSGARNIVSIRHTKSAKGRLEEAHKVMGASETYWEKIREAYGIMASKQLKTDEVNKLLTQVFPGKPLEITQPDGKTLMLEEVATRTQNNRNSVLALFEGGARGSNMAGKTAWGFFNAVTEWIDNHRSVRGETNMWEASVFGSGESTRQKAFELSMAMAT